MSTLTINVLTTISLVWLAALIFAVVYKIIKMVVNKETAKLYGFLKGFKKGSCFLVYFASIPLYFCALYYNKGDAAYAFFYAIERSVRLIVLIFNYSDLSALIAVNTYYAAVVYICLSAVILNAVLFAISLAGMRLLNFIYKRKALSQKNNIYVLVGFGINNGQIIKSISDKGAGKKGKYSVLLVNKSDIRKKDELNLLMLENKSAYAEYSSAKFCGTLEKFIAKKKQWEKKSVNIIINTEDECENLLLTKELKKFIDNHSEINHSILNRKGINGYVFCQPKDISIYNFYVENTHGAIQYINKYRLIAIDFIGKYPLTKYMTDEIDAEYPTIKKDVQVNLVMIGFGKLCRQIFNTSVSTQQFVAVDNGKITGKPVRYCIYDKIDSNADLVLNHNYYRYENFVKMNKDRQSEFLPFPDVPADVQFHKMNICDKEFYQSLYGDLNGADNYSYIVVSYGTDMENLDFGQKLSAKLKEWNLQSKVKLFVKIRNGSLVKDSKNGEIIFFGDESDTIYNIDVILHEKIENLAKKRSLLYSQEDTKEQGEELAVKASEKWFKQSQCQRESNIYACLSLRPKLNLLGFDIRTKNDCNANKNAADGFIEKYENGDKIRTGRELPDGRKEIIYGNKDFDKLSVRKVFAVSEHRRWNANYISWGYVPASRKEIEESSENGKDASIRRHGCLTTFDGLKEYREIAARKFVDLPYEDALEKADVIRYDYQLMDDAVWLLNTCGYEIITKN